MNARTVHELPWQLNGRRAASPARKQDAHASEEPEPEMQCGIPAERDGSTRGEQDLVRLHAGNPCLFLSGIGQKRHRGLRTANQAAAGCGGAFQRVCVLSATAWARQLDKL